MQRVRAGLTGLAAIFLMVLIAAAGMRPDRSVAPAGSHGETLATLGVAPGPGDNTRREVAERRPATVKPTPRRPTTI